MDNRLKINTPVEYPIYPIDVLNFDGSTLVAGQMLGTTSNGALDMSFKLWLDQDTNYANAVLEYNSSTGTNTQCFSAFLYNSSLYIGQRVFGAHKSFSIAGKQNKILECIIRKNENGTDNFDFFKINGITQTPGPSLTAISDNGYPLFGGGVTSTATVSFKNLKNATIWDIRITEVSTGIRKHWWHGFHDASVQAGWKDQIDETAYYSPIHSVGLNYITTRTIGGQQNFPSNQLHLNTASANKLILGQPIIDISVSPFGYIYNFYAASSTNFAPTGYHLPTDAEWTTLTNNVPSYNTGGAFKQVGTQWWTAPNSGAVDTYGFTALPTGTRAASWSSTYRQVDYWTSTIAVAGQAWQRRFLYDSSTFFRQAPTFYWGAAIRFVKDNAVDNGSVLDYEGNSYPTITIGTQVWTAKDWKSKYYFNGNLIPGPTYTDASWAGLTTDAYCTVPFP